MSILIDETTPVLVQGMTGERFDLVTPDRNMGRAAIEGWLSLEAATTMLEMAGWLVRNTGVLSSLEQLVKVLRLEDEAYRALRMADWERSAETVRSLAVES